MSGFNHGFGRKNDSADSRDIRYGATREAVTIGSIPAYIDLRHDLPPVYDQGLTNSCGAQAGAALMAHLFPEVESGFSPSQIYYSVRVIEGDVDKDDGVETRNVMKALKDVGAAPEPAYPFDPEKILDAPPPDVIKIAASYRIGSYARLNGANDFLRCLASGHPFVMGFMVPQSLDENDIDRTGIMPNPDFRRDPIIGGHDVLVVGYDTTFKHAPFFKNSGIDPALVDDTMLLVRNSWGPGWSRKFRGHFWMPISYAVNRSTGGDAWTGRRDAALKATLPAVQAVPEPTRGQMDAAFAAARGALDQTSYGGWVSDEKLRPVSDEIARAVVRAK
jgi:C1A family cysteine protease